MLSAEEFMEKPEEDADDQESDSPETREAVAELSTAE